MAQALDTSDHFSYILIEFSYGNPVKLERWTNWSSTVDPLGSNYSAIPTMLVKLPPNVGILKAKDCQITVERNDLTSTFLDLVSSTTRKVGPVHCTLIEVTKGTGLGQAGSQTMPVQGRLASVKSFVKGKVNQMRLDIRNIKARLDVPLGFQCGTNCIFRVFGPGCSRQDGSFGPQLSVFKKAATVASISGSSITMDAGPWNALASPLSYRFGFVEFDDIRIEIQEWRPGTDINTLILRRPPPSSWSSKTVDLTPGCANTVDACREWSNEDRFCGLGIAMPDYDPLLDEP